MVQVNQQKSEPLSALYKTKYGHFSDDGHTYVVTRHDTPRPWINILSNGSYGTTISQNGGGFTWWENANLARMTCWNQDLIKDESGKYIYLRDDESGEIWSASWQPVNAEYDLYEVHHSVGYTTFVQQYNGIETRWTVVIPPEDSIEIWRLEIKNLGDRPRKISVFSYLEWCLGNGGDWHREFQKTFIETNYNEKLSAVIGIKRRMPIPPHISTGMSELPLSGFHSVNKKIVSYSGNKEEFLGRYGKVGAPEAVVKGKNTNSIGRWHDSVASLHVQVDLKPNAEDTVVFVLGKHDEDEATETMIHRYCNPDGVEQAIEGAKQLWAPFLNRVRVETPDPAFDVMTNIWLKYQAISCRVWAKTAYYQSSAANGYRDQLQDSHIFLPTHPELCLKQIKLHAAHQNKDGSVLHWWFPIPDQGPISHHSDTTLWLPYLTLNYLDETADFKALNDGVPYLDGAEQPLFDHCVASIQRVIKLSSKRGLPLILSGDWNDGLTFVGTKKKGESIWLGHFLHGIMVRFADTIDRLREEKVKIKGYTPAKLASLARSFRSKAEKLKEAINKHGWDGKWYWRATRDNGTLLGSKKCKEGKIFLNAQTWALICGSGTPSRVKTAMKSVEEHLDQDYGPLLFTPAYTVPDETIGYLSRYAPGVRENGGVYTHAANWAIIAECMLGNGDIAWRMYNKINPPKRGMDADLYCGEPYVMPGNTEGPESPYFGRAGWTWYTGSAAWYFRAATEWILGVRPTVDGLVVDPCIPTEWDGFTQVRQYRGATYHVKVENPENVSCGVTEITVDGEKLKKPIVPVFEDGQVHEVHVVLGKGGKRAK